MWNKTLNKLQSSTAEQLNNGCSKLELKWTQLTYLFVINYLIIHRNRSLFSNTLSVMTSIRCALCVVLR